MSDIVYSELTDEELMKGYVGLYDLYVKIQEERTRSFPGLTPEIVDGFTFRIRNDYLEEVIRRYKELMYELCLEHNSNGAIPITVAKMTFNYNIICDYIRNQVATLSLYAAIMKGMIGNNSCLCYNSYAYAIGHASDIRIGFEKHEFLNCESGSFDNMINAKQMVSVLNTINKVLNMLANKYVAGSSKVGRLSKKKQEEYGLLASEPELYERMSVFYNTHNSIVSFANNSVGKFYIVE